MSRQDESAYASTPATTAPPKSRLRKSLGFIVGIALVGIAIYIITSGSASVGAALGRLRSPDPLALAIVLAMPLANIALTAWAFLVLNRHYGRVGAMEMNALIAGAWFLNYLPMRPGMVGRIAYHKRVNAIPIKASIHVTCIEAMLGLPSAAFVLALCVPLMQASAPAWLWGAIAALLIAGGGASIVWSRIAQLPMWRMSAALLIRVLDHAAWALRIWAGFALLGHPIDAASATVIGMVGQLSLMVPVTGNGLGVREWAAALTAELLAGAGVARAFDESVAKELALAATLLVRAGELVSCAPIGLIASAWVSRRALRSGGDDADNSQEKPGN